MQLISSSRIIDSPSKSSRPSSPICPETSDSISPGLRQDFRYVPNLPRSFSLKTGFSVYCSRKPDLGGEQFGVGHGENGGSLVIGLVKPFSGCALLDSDRVEDEFDIQEVEDGDLIMSNSSNSSLYAAALPLLRQEVDIVFVVQRKISVSGVKEAENKKMEGRKRETKPVGNSVSREPKGNMRLIYLPNATQS
ncbi:auxin response factor 2 [Striga asiatica]|uniref:Auxin response factor 2 n=1 Tax=Striga asiatica TaxID=4170 RepID=A0A5A7P294_STRAF|nr:auxin response factor 2 [Striga asiatica]